MLHCSDKSVQKIHIRLHGVMSEKYYLSPILYKRFCYLKQITISSHQEGIRWIRFVCHKKNSILNRPNELRLININGLYKQAFISDSKKKGFYSVRIYRQTPNCVTNVNVLLSRVDTCNTIYVSQFNSMIYGCPNHELQDVVLLHYLHDKVK